MAEETTQLEDERKDPNEWLEEITCDLGLRQHLDAEIKRAESEYHKSANPSWYPSDLGKDLFVRFIKRKGYDSLPMNPRTLRKFEIGKLWEARLHQVIDARIARGEGNIKEIDLHPEATNEAFKKRVEDNELELRGYYDRLLLVKPNMFSDEWWVVVYEIKSVASTSFHKQKKEGEQPLGNRMQMMFYLKRMSDEDYWNKIVGNCQKLYGITPTKIVGVLSQVSKDDGSMWERTYELDKDMYSRIEREIRALNEFWKKGELPPKPDLIIFEDGVAKVNWEISYSNFVHHIIGRNYASVLLKATQLTRRHTYYRTKAPSKVAEVVKEIEEFNASIK